MRKGRVSKQIGAIALSAGVFLSTLAGGSPSAAYAAEHSAWKTDVMTSVVSLRAAMDRGVAYEQAKNDLKDALTGLEKPVIVDNLKVVNVTEDTVTLQWDAADVEGIVGYNVYWADKNLEGTKFQLLAPSGEQAQRMSRDLDENGKKKPAPELTVEAGDESIVTFTAKFSTFYHNYFKVALVTENGVGTASAVLCAPTAVEHDTILDKLGRGLIAVQKPEGVFLNWRMLADDADGGAFKDESGQGLTGNNFNVYRNGEKIAYVENSCNYLDTAVTQGLTKDMYSIAVTDKNGYEISEQFAVYQVLTQDPGNKDAAFIEFKTYAPEAKTVAEIYGIDKCADMDKNMRITYNTNDASVVDVDGDGEYEVIVEWNPNNAKDVSQWGYTGKQYFDCYKIDGTLLWRLDMGVNIRSGAHYTQFLAFDFEGDGRGELVLKTAPGTKMIQYKLDSEGKNVLGEDGKPVAAAEKYITLPASDVANGVTNEDSYVNNPEMFRDQMIETFMDWGVWNRYSDSTRKGIIGYWPNNAVVCFTADPEWRDGAFYTGENGNAKDIKNMPVADIQKYVPEYQPGDKLVPVALNGYAKNTNSGMKTVLVSQVKDYPGNIDLSKVDKDVKGVGYTREEAEILADYVIQHYSSTNGRHDFAKIEGFILDGPEYLTLFDAKTGEELDTQYYHNVREDDGLVWGDYGWRAGMEPGNRVDRFNACVAYLDGETPTAVFGRGYYARTSFEAWNVKNGKLEFLSSIDSGPLPMTNPFNDNEIYQDGSDPVNGNLAASGQHHIAAVDVNLDGRQEVLNGGSIIGLNKNGLYLYNNGGDYIGGDETKGWRKSYHGDMMHITDLDPDLPGVEVALCHEGGKGPWDWAVRTLYTNNVLFGSFGGKDVGRLTVGDMERDIRGIEVDQGYAADGKKVKLSASNSNHSLRWRPDMTTQFVGGNEGSDVSLSGQGKTYANFKGFTSNNSSKGNPALTADFFGDFREEIMLRAKDSSVMRIYMNTEVSDRKNYTPMQNLQYRAHVSGQQSAYNMPSYVNYYYAYDTDWEFVTVPNQKRDQAPGVVTGVVAGSELETLPREDVDISGIEEDLPVESWLEMQDALNALLVKMEDFDDDTTPLQFDRAVADRMNTVAKLADTLKGVSLAECEEGDAYYALAEEEAQYIVSWSEGSIARLKAAMAQYKQAKENLLADEELEAIENVLLYWMEGVDLSGAPVYSKFFDFNDAESNVESTGGWTAVNVSGDGTVLTDCGLELVEGSIYTDSSIEDTLLCDWIAAPVVRIELAAGDYQASVYSIAMENNVEATHSFFAGYEDAQNVGTKIAGSEDVVSIEKGTVAKIPYFFSLEEDSAVVFVGNDNVCALRVEDASMAAVAAYDSTKLQALMDEISFDELVEEDYTVNSYKALKDAYEAAVAGMEKEALSGQEGISLYEALLEAWNGMVLRAGIVSYNIDFGPRTDSSKGTPQLEANGQSAAEFNTLAVAGAVRPAFQLGHGDMLYTDNVSDDGMHWGFDQVIPDGNTGNGGAYFRDWVYAPESGATPYTFKADLPCGDYFVFVYTGMKETYNNTTKLYFDNEVYETTNTVSETDENGRTVYTQKAGTGGQYAYANSQYFVHVTENPDALSKLSGLNVGTLSVTLFDDTNSSQVTGCMNGIEIFPVRLDAPTGAVKKVMISGLSVEDKVYDGQSVVVEGNPEVTLLNGDVIEDVALTYHYVGKNGTDYDSEDAPKNVGDYELEVSVDPAVTNYGGKEVLPFSITKAQLTVKPCDVKIVLIDGIEEAEELSEVEVTEAEATELEVTEAEATELEVTEAEAREVEVAETEAETTEVEETGVEVTEGEVTEGEATEGEVTEEASAETEAPTETEAPAETEAPTEVANEIEILPEAISDIYDITLVWDGLVEGDDVRANLEPIFETNVGETLAVGEYIITWVNGDDTVIEGEDAGNYEITKETTARLSVVTDDDEEEEEDPEPVVPEEPIVTPTEDDDDDEPAAIPDEPETQAPASETATPSPIINPVPVRPTAPVVNRVPVAAPEESTEETSTVSEASESTSDTVEIPKEETPKADTVEENKDDKPKEEPESPVVTEIPEEETAKADSPNATWAWIIGSIAIITGLLGILIWFSRRQDVE